MNTKGFTLVTGVLLLMAVMLMGLLSISSLHLTSGGIHTYFKKGQELLAIGDSCLEEGALRLKRDAMFRTTSLILSGNSCIIYLEDPIDEIYSGTVVISSVNGEQITNGIALKRIERPQSVQIQIISYTTL